MLRCKVTMVKILYEIPYYRNEAFCIIEMNLIDLFPESSKTYGL
jgi:hypothetical protein